MRWLLRCRLVAVCGVAGAALPLAFAPFEWFWLAPVSYACLFYSWRKATPGEAFRLGLLYGAASFAVGLYWLYISIHSFGHVGIALTLLLSAALVLVLALYIGLTGWLAARWLSTYGAFAWLGVLPALFVLTEWVRGWLFSGFGWLSAGYTQTDSWAVGLAAVLGMHGMSWLVLFTAGVLLTLVFGSNRSRVIAVVLGLVFWGGAFGLKHMMWTRPVGEPIQVSLVQGAIPQELKWAPAEFDKTLRRYRRLTKQHPDSQLIVWPEAAIPTLYSYIPGYISRLSSWARQHDTVILLGILRGNPDQFQNTVVALPDTHEIYIKHHLVPFGEYFPVPDFVRHWMRLMSLPYTDAEPGPANQLPLNVAGQRIGVSICYEDVFGAEQLHYLPEATLLVNVSNDAWFGRSIAAPQHLQISRLRAAEAGRYLLRATNTGITAVIGPAGQVLKRLPQFQPGVLTTTVTGMSGATPYSRWGNYPVIVAALILVLIQWVITKLSMRPGT